MLNRSIITPTSRILRNSVRCFRSDLTGTDVYRSHQKDDLAEQRAMNEYVNVKPSTIKVAVTGAAGAIGYSLLFRLASGEVFGKNQRVQIRCVELPFAMNPLKGVAMELQDCSFPLLDGVFCTDDAERGFEDIDVALLVGSQPRKDGMERADLLKINGGIFTGLGRALNKWARPSVKVTVVGNPANTNCLIASANAPDIPVENFSAMTRLDHDRGIGQLAKMGGVPSKTINDFCIWGNHSSTMYPDITRCSSNGKPILNVLENANQGTNVKKWYTDEFIPTVQNRGAAIIKARGASSAASAANACIAHARDWELGSNGTSMAVYSNGEYGISKGLFYSFPVTTNASNYKIVEGINIDEFSQKMMKTSEAELMKERDMVKDFLP